MLFLLAMRASDKDTYYGFFASAAGLLGLFVCLIWIFFPFMVNSHFKTLTRRHDDTNALLPQILAAKGTDSKLPLPPKVQPAALPTVPAPTPKSAGDVYKI